MHTRDVLHTEYSPVDVDPDPVARRAGIVLDRPRPRRWWPFFAVVAICALVAGATLAVLRPGPAIGPTKGPSEGQTAVGLLGSRLQTYGSQQPVPIGSVAKVMTAYLILRHHPLHAGQDGPRLHVDTAAAADYQNRRSSGQSLLEVRDGDELTERQALEALLIPSANNIADLLASWDAGSVSAFVAGMNRTSRQLGLTNTHYADPSGFDPDTASTAVDQTRLAERAMRDSTFAGIVDEREVWLPRAGEVKNYNALLGHDGVVGIKTGSTDQAGGAVVFAARDGDRMIVGAVLGQKIGGSTRDSLAQAFGVARYLIGSVAG
jgi:serine-type D-Ala-D-Ala carboxypeptidase (penicillin-binding protein 5/6)